MGTTDRTSARPRRRLPARVHGLTTAVVVAALLLVTTGCEPDPALPAQLSAPTTTTTASADPSWYVAPVGGSCPTTGASATFTQAKWDDWVAARAPAGTARPDQAPLQGVRVLFPAGCYYMSDFVNFDLHHTLTDVALDGAYTGDPTKRPVFVQLNDPRTTSDGFGSPMMRLSDSMAHITGFTTARVSIAGFVLQGSKPDGVPYQGNSASGIALIGGVEDVRVTGSEVHHIWGDAIYVGDTKRVMLDHNYLHHTNRNIVTVTGGSNVEVDSNRMEHSAGPLFSIETNAGSFSVDTVYVHDNDGSNAYDQEDADMRGHGLLWNVTANPGTSVRNITFARNRSTTALVMWSRVGTSATLPTGVIDTVLFEGNTTTSGAGGIIASGGRNIKFRDNTIKGRAFATYRVSGTRWTNNPPDMSIGTDPRPEPCGTASGNTYVDGNGVTQAMPMVLTDGTVVTTFPAC